MSEAAQVILPCHQKLRLPCQPRKSTKHWGVPRMGFWANRWLLTRSLQIWLDVRWTNHPLWNLDSKLFTSCIHVGWSRQESLPLMTASNLVIDLTPGGGWVASPCSAPSGAKRAGSHRLSNCYNTFYYGIWGRDISLSSSPPKRREVSLRWNSVHVLSNFGAGPVYGLLLRRILWACYSISQQTGWTLHLRQSLSIGYIGMNDFFQDPLPWSSLSSLALKQHGTLAVW